MRTDGSQRQFAGNEPPPPEQAAAEPEPERNVKIRLLTNSFDNFESEYFAQAVMRHYPDIEVIIERIDSSGYDEEMNLRLAAGDVDNFDIVAVSHTMIDNWSRNLVDLDGISSVRSAAQNTNAWNILRDNNGTLRLAPIEHRSYGINARSDKAELCRQIFGDLYDPNSALHRTMTEIYANNTGAEYDGWLYFRKWDDAKFYRITKDGTTLRFINSDYVSSISIEDGYIYYSLWRHDTPGIYKIRVDGTGRTQITDDSAASPLVYNGWVYYSNESDGRKLYRISIDGGRKELLYDGTCGSLNLDRRTGAILFIDYTTWENMAYDPERNEIRLRN
jgi:hypothetical protein